MHLLDWIGNMIEGNILVCQSSLRRWGALLIVTLGTTAQPFRLVSYNSRSISRGFTSGITRNTGFDAIRLSLYRQARTVFQAFDVTEPGLPIVMR
jgi:hypothetical protein